MYNGWKTARLGDLCSMVKGEYPTEKTPPGSYPLVVTAEEFRTADSYQLEGEAVCIPTISSTGHGHASLKRVHFVAGRFAVANLLVAAQPKSDAQIAARWLWLYLNHYRDELIVPLMQGTANVNLKPADLADIPIHHPPLAEQRRIVDLLSALDDLHEAARREAKATEKAYGAILRSIASAAPRRPLVDCVAIAKAGGTPSRAKARFYGGNIPWLKSSEVANAAIRVTSETITDEGLRNSSAWLVPRGATVVAMYGATAGAVGRTEIPLATNQAVLALVAKPNTVEPALLFHLLRGQSPSLKRRAVGAAQPNLSKDRVLSIEIPVPNLTDQPRLTALLDSLLATGGGAERLVRAIRDARVVLVRDLMSGRRSIPPAYDQLLDGAA
jgi:type I restriction enzyme, S subunit